MNQPLQIHSSMDLAPRNLEEAMKFADLLSKSTIVPKDFIGNPGNIFVAIQWGAELGLKPMQAMQNIAVINGRPSLWGDAVIALVRSSSLCEHIYETFENGVAICRVKRRGEDEQTRTFSEEDARTAGLLGKAGVWQQHKKRMMQMRARAFALRDVFPDVLKGMPVAEEVMDYEIIEKDVTPKAKAIESAKQLLTDEQVEQLKNAISIAGISEEAFCANKKINIASLGELPTARFNGAIAYLKTLAIPKEPASANN